MAKWKIEKKDVTEHDGEVETTSYEATITVDADDPDDPVTLDNLADLIDNLKTVRGIPGTAKLGTSINAPLRWTTDDLS